MSLLSKKFYCEHCNFFASYKSQFAKHLDTKKHKRNLEFCEKSKMDFYCKKCDFRTSNKYDMEKHCATQKHKKISFSQKKISFSQKKISETQINNENTICIETPRLYQCGCGKTYKYRQGLYTHRKKCNFIEKQQNSEKEKSGKNINFEKDKNEKLEKQLEETNKKIEDSNKKLQDSNKKLELCMDIIQNQVIPNIQNTSITNINNTTNNMNNNNFNLNIFLNETCKDAINMTEFIENLKVGLQELEFVKDNGIVKGISNVFVSELNALDVDKRPIHCTDAKRKTLYIKEDNKWDKENKATNEKIDRSIQHVKKKHVDSIKEWEAANPNWCDDEKLAMEYLRMVRNSTTPIDKFGEKKIISDISNEVDITDIKNKVND